jgi:endonuclease-3
VEELHRRLAEAYEVESHPPGSDPVGTLVNTILSQNTNDRNRDVAYERLRERFPTWEEVRDAPSEEVVEAIRPAGLAPSKGPWIQGALELLTEEQGGITLDFLREMPLEEAREWLTDVKGVGPKTAAIVLLFALERSAFPVDTHVHRVSRRLGLIEEDTSREKAHAVLEARVPKELYYPFHVELIEHGRAVCAARTPRCEECMVPGCCRYYQEEGEG